MTGARVPRRTLRRAVAVAVLFWPAVAAALDLPPGLEADPGGPATVTEVIDGDTLALDDGRRVRLVGVQALEIDHDNLAATDPLAIAARDALADLALDRQVVLAYGGARQDRFGRALAHVFRADGVWLQRALLDAGLVHVYSFADNRTLVPTMLSHEQTARAAERGLWRDRPATDHADAGALVGSYGWVEGTVIDTAVVRGRAYLNFGADYRTDFTISVAPDNLDVFAALDAYRGQRVRVRGWLQSINGPMIEITHPEQIEVLSP